ncbi:DUF5683 domain-containing protein [Tenacibaculum holothuriorum]|uniref:DUF5683 domain-containing protein n=1 Tax=Tenacibaculum holothuriorum TaxID=1635173 RepID=UPI001E2FC8F9|nr:DUF5683 domain-containing protein [Tenacibaculum holothuriorum]
MCQLSFAQKDSTRIKAKQLQIVPEYNPLSPSKAAFYSAILPGAGQIYNNRYWWQLPAIYGGLVFFTYQYIDNDNQYDRYRTAFKLRSQGLPDEFNGLNGNPNISTAGLENAQKVLRKNRDLSLLGAVVVYVLQIVEASVRAHLLQFETNDNLSISPTVTPDPMLVEAPKVGFRLKYSF